MALEQTVQDGIRVLDVGTGSGILSIAAAKLGAQEVVGIDTDPLAVQAAVTNAEQNDVDQTTRFFRVNLRISLTVIGMWWWLISLPQ